jgi:D-tyrosyl-tRNA(Tyr) deacylase
VKYFGAKSPALRLFKGDEGKDIDRSVMDIGGSLLVVSQFTLLGDARGQRRPSFIDAAPPDRARALYEDLVRELRAASVPVATGEFQAMMRVELVNDGPVTLLLDSKRAF